MKKSFKRNIEVSPTNLLKIQKNYEFLENYKKNKEKEKLK